MTTEGAKIALPGTGTEMRDVARRIREQRLAWSGYTRAGATRAWKRPGGCDAGWG
ncbi:hypothetical protein ES332_D06G184100v1 [Gossypium tomentosum]|uniref:Uncharacterized protein n=1 Tax=Gossypium tomentosum TaxID=34277 RepID=A0A5D2KL45_GOSTO|nr:hypothetical protein ES332_D06G184100v1 [Gossypium tomentosum]